MSNSTTAVLDSDQIMYCRLDLDNQAPFLMWTSPQDGAIFPSQGEVEFNASDSWDLDDDILTFTWTSSIDGWLSDGGVSVLTGNGLTAPSVGLSDGIHVITLELCDDAGHCVSESRTIELTNLAPELSVTLEPSLTQSSELIMPQTLSLIHI